MRLFVNKEHEVVKLFKTKLLTSPEQNNKYSQTFVIDRKEKTMQTGTCKGFHKENNIMKNGKREQVEVKKI